jgi:hypothetical protein
MVPPLIGWSPEEVDQGLGGTATIHVSCLENHFSEPIHSQHQAIKLAHLSTCE